MGVSDELLLQALKIVAGADVDVAAYQFVAVGGATQATVWRGTARDRSGRDLALRLTPKPLPLITRIAALVDAVSDAACPRTLALGQLPAGGRSWTVQLCTWIGTGAPHRPDMHHPRLP